MTIATSDPLEIDTVTGRVVVPPSDVIQMVQPLPGFEACRRYVLIAAPELAPFTCLHGVDAPHPVFVTVDPHRVDPSSSSSRMTFRPTVEARPPHRMSQSRFGEQARILSMANGAAS